MKGRKLHFIDLFAGCGGLSLGLELAGFEPMFVNELSPDAMETYLINRKKTHPHLLEKYNINDVKSIVAKKGKVLNDLMAGWSRDFGVKANKGEVDLLVGGPPCQGFSGIGHRRSYSVEKAQLPSNYLYEDMAYIIHRVKPKIFLFENVKGLMTAKWSESGVNGEIWDDVKKTFEAIPGYIVKYQLVYAKDYGVPQNRPRILLVGISEKLGTKLKQSLPAEGLLPVPSVDYPDIEDVLGDIVDSKYLNGGSTSKYPNPASTTIQEWLRKSQDGAQIAAKGDPLTEHDYSHHRDDIVAKFRYMQKHSGKIHPSMRTKKFSQRLLTPSWGKMGPSITATSLPDDYVHYSQPRTLTVREWARIQTFPDWYQFSGKRTTGGIRRAGNPRAGIFEREVPKYTQIGNAVPVLLAKAVGSHFMKLLQR